MNSDISAMEKTCEACGKTFGPKYGPKQFSAARACSRSCANKLGQKNRRRTSMEERFWSKVDKTQGLGPSGCCWEWMGRRLPFGYGVFRVGGKVKKAHRVGYELQVGLIAEGSNVLHHCDNPACVRADHLFIGTHYENMADMVSKGRGDAPKGESHHDAKLTEDQVRAIRLDGRPNTVIAAELGVTKGAIWQIKARRNWRHIE